MQNWHQYVEKKKKKVVPDDRKKSALIGFVRKIQCCHWLPASNGNSCHCTGWWCVCVCRCGRSRAASVCGGSNAPTVKGWHVPLSVKTAASSSAPPSTRPSGETRQTHPWSRRLPQWSESNNKLLCIVEFTASNLVKRWRSSAATPPSSTRPPSHQTATTSSAPLQTGRSRLDNESRFI